eukprot:c23104_g2_i1 orf=152-466(-)
MELLCNGFKKYDSLFCCDLYGTNKGCWHSSNASNRKFPNNPKLWHSCSFQNLDTQNEGNQTIKKHLGSPPLATLQASDQAICNEMYNVKMTKRPASNSPEVKIQ